MTDSTKSIVIPTFSGKDEEFQLWWTKFRAFATAKGVIPSLLGKESDLPTSEAEVLNENLTSDKKKIKARERNSLAMAYLLTAFKSAADVSLAYETMSNDWPGGLAYEVVNKLKEAYQPKDSVTEVELYERLLSVKMKAKDDPRTLFEQVASIQNWYNDGNRQVPKEQLMAVVLRAAPKEYASVLTDVQRVKGTNLEVSHLRMTMNMFYRFVYKRVTGEESNDELALVGQNNTNETYTKKKKKFNGKCHYCGKVGHTKAECWENPINADKRPKWYRPRSEVAAAGRSENSNNECSEELQLVNMQWGRYADEFEDDIEDEEYEAAVEEMKQERIEFNTETALRMAAEHGDKSMITLLEDPEVFVIDTGATCHSTGNCLGMTDMKDAKGSKTRMGNGAKIETKAIGKLPFRTNDGTKGVMNDVHLIPGAAFNLVSGTKQNCDGSRRSSGNDKSSASQNLINQ